ncbi:MAG: hypothetical protein QOF56_71 [Acidobacteriaceae bacterium]|jgi:hypothetical protein|nr:hypothetical protein [Acidobacteriaceae bacterium]
MHPETCLNAGSTQADARKAVAEGVSYFPLKSILDQPRPISRVYLQWPVDELGYCSARGAFGAFGVQRWQAGELQSKAEFRLPARLQDNHVSEREFGRDKLFVHIRFLRLLTRDDNSFKRYVW